MVVVSRVGGISVVLGYWLRDVNSIVITGANILVVLYIMNY